MHTQDCYTKQLEREKRESKEGYTTENREAYKESFTSDATNNNDRSLVGLLTYPNTRLVWNIDTEAGDVDVNGRILLAGVVDNVGQRRLPMLTSN
jgi:hypothetical protein